MPEFSVKSNKFVYNVVFIKDTIKALVENITHDDVVIIDNNIIEHYPLILGSLDHKIKVIRIDATEHQKSYTQIIPIIRSLISEGFKKNNRLFAFGGGITQDITAFISSILYRGVDWIFFPTTLLAQGDSCIGSKTSINFEEYKNQVGGFYPPRKIFINLDFLETLSDAQLKSGLGEMCHYYIVAGESDFNRYRADYRRAIVDHEILAELIYRSLEIKKGYIEIDEYDQKERNVFNYGHSFGHAIESITNYDIPHGIAVSYGMDIANYISVNRGILDPNVRLEIRGLLEQIWAGFHIKSIDIDRFVNALNKDKKNTNKELRLVLCKGYGKTYIQKLKPDETFIGLLKTYFKEEI